jgi:phosphate transport system protein
VQVEKGHTSREFDRELRQLRDKLLAMGGRAEQQIARAVQAMVKRDDSLSQQVIADDASIDQDEIGIDELAFLILARRQPVASDLRFVMLAVKVVTDLERIGDLAVNIAKRVKDLSRFPVAPTQEHIEILSQRVLAALQLALDAFVHADAERAERVIDGDKDIDALNTKVISEVISAADSEDPNVVPRALALSSVSRYLERIGDHATNIAEMVIYFVRGRDVRHHWPRPRG